MGIEVIVRRVEWNGLQDSLDVFMTNDAKEDLYKLYTEDLEGYRAEPEDDYEKGNYSYELTSGEYRICCEIVETMDLR